MELNWYCCYNSYLLYRVITSDVIPKKIIDSGNRHTWIKWILCSRDDQHAVAEESVGAPWSSEPFQ